MVCDLIHRSNVEAFSSSASFAIGRASDAPVAPPAMRRLGRSLSQRPTPENDAEIGGRRFREDTAVPRPSAPWVERCFFVSEMPCDTSPRRHTGLGPLTTSLLGSHGFAAVVTGHFALSNRLDSTPLFYGDGGCRSQAPVHVPFLIDAGRFFEPDEAFRLLQRVFKYDARTRFCELDPRPPQGTALRALPLIVAPFGAARFLLLDGRRCVPDVPQRATRDFPDIRARDPDPSSRNRSPFERRLLSGPEGHGMRADRTNSSKGEVAAPLRTATPCAGLRLEVPPRCSFEPLVSSAMRARRDGSPFACFYTSALPT